MLAILIFLLITISFYMTYSRVWEYQYAHALVVIPGLLFVLNNGKDILSPLQLRLLKIPLFACVLFYIPALHFLYKDDLLGYLPICRLPRIIPVIVIYSYLILTIELSLIPEIKLSIKKLLAKQKIKRRA